MYCVGHGQYGGYGSIIQIQFKNFRFVKYLKLEQHAFLAPSEAIYALPWVSNSRNVASLWPD